MFIFFSCLLERRLLVDDLLSPRYMLAESIYPDGRGCDISSLEVADSKFQTAEALTIYYEVAESIFQTAGTCDFISP